MIKSALLALAVFSTLAQSGVLKPDAPINCEDCRDWNVDKKPARVFGNTYNVGVAGLSTVLIATDAGLILLDGALPESAPLIDQHIRALGFKTADIKYILTSHAHFDHVGGVNALQRASGATVLASESAARALARGEPTTDDPQYRYGPNDARFPAIANVRTVKDGEKITLGGVTVTAHFTPGHTPGSMSWSWRSCEDSRCQDIVYADSLNAVSRPDYRYTASTGGPSMAEQLRRSIATVAALPCDRLIAVHPTFAEGQTCKTYAAAAAKRLETRISEEKKQ